MAGDRLNQWLSKAGFSVQIKQRLVFCLYMIFHDYWFVFIT